MIRQVKKLIPDSIKVWLKARIASSEPGGWSGNYRNWKEASKACEGYNKAEILEKVKMAVMAVKRGEAAYERDSVLFKEPFVFPPLAEALKSCVQKNRLHLCDFGGSLGSSYFQYKHLFSGLSDFKWSVVEQKHFVETGQKEVAEGDLNFCFTIEETLAKQENHVLFLSSVLQYLPEPYEFIKKLMTFKFEYVVLDRTGFIEGKKERLTKQIVPESIYKASYPAWFFDERNLKKAFTGSYDFVMEFLNDTPMPMLLSGEKVYWKGFLLKRKNG